MPIARIFKDILEVEKGVIIHGCNAQGVMGSGVAKQIKAKYPGAYLAYRKEWQSRKLKVGDTIWYEVNSELFIINAITQEYYGRPGPGEEQIKYASVEGIQTALRETFKLIQGTGLEKKIYIPKLGCGLGGLNWNDEVEPAVRKVIGEFEDYMVWICITNPPWEIAQYHMHYGKLNNK